MRPTIALSINSSWNILNFRAGLVRGLLAAGYRVVAITPDDGVAHELAALGIEHIPITMDTRGTSPQGEARLFVDYLRILRKLKPDVYLGYTIKPNIWGSLAAHLLRIPTINNIAGLGDTFLGKGAINRVVRTLYRLALARAAWVFFQNPDDRALFEAGKLVDPGRTQLLPGSGVDVSRFSPSADKPRPGPSTRFLMVARLLHAKGIAELAAASDRLRGEFPDVSVSLLGLEQTGPGAVSRAQIDAWNDSGALRFLGGASDVRPHLASADCVVLPTYYPEGTPRSLLEAAASGLPIITTDVPGCREIVRPEINGFLCEPRSVDSLTASMRRFIMLPPEERARMGTAGRALAEERFDEKIVIARYLDAIAAILNPPARVR